MSKKKMSAFHGINVTKAVQTCFQNVSEKYCKVYLHILAMATGSTNRFQISFEQLCGP